MLDTHTNNHISIGADIRNDRAEKKKEIKERGAKGKISLCLSILRLIKDWNIGSFPGCGCFDCKANEVPWLLNGLSTTISHQGSTINQTFLMAQIYILGKANTSCKKQQLIEPL